MHSLVYLAICAVSIGGVLLLGIPKDASMVIVAASGIALIGVPHGGLDHWIGRRLLQPRLNRGWWIAFFLSYLAIGIAVTLGWFVEPTITVVLFFLASAWHFGREDQQAECSNVSPLWRDRLFHHVAAIALGGLVIWVPALARPDEFRTLLDLIVSPQAVGSVEAIVVTTQCIAWCLVPLALSVVVHRLAVDPTDLHRWVPIVTAAVGIGLPILLSFSLYFCGWHSWQALQRLRQSESLTTPEFAWCVAPLSVSAIVGVAVMGCLGKRWLADSSTVEQTRHIVSTLFIGLSVIAVPHLILHELHSFATSSRAKREVCE